MAAYELLLLNTAIPQIQAAQSGDTYVVPRDIAFSTVANLANGTNLLPSLTFSSDTNTGIYREGADALGFTAGGGTNQMVLTSTGLGIGTNLPAAKLQVSATNNQFWGKDSATSNNFIVQNASGAVRLNAFTSANAAMPIIFSHYVTDVMTLDTSGNLGLGVTPSAWSNIFKVLQINSQGALMATSASMQMGNNIYYDGDYKFIGTGYANRYYQATGQHVWTVSTASGSANGTITETQAMTLDASGNLQLGTTTSSTRTITVGGASVSIALAGSNGGIYFGAAGTPAGSGGFGSNAAIARAGGANFHISGSADGDLCIAPEGTKAILFGTSASAGSVTERARITSGGDLLVGTTDSSPIGNGVKGIVLNGTDARFDINRNGATPVFVGRFTSSGTLIDFYYAGVSKGSISTDGTNVAYNTSSDYRLKNNPQPLTGSGAFIDALKPKTWNWKTDGSNGVGFIAHEVQAVSPNSVVGTKDAVDEEGKPVMQAMEYGSAEFIANIIAELQSLRARVAQLEQGA